MSTEIDVSGGAPLVGELAGLAGAGKSTIGQALVRLDSGLRLHPRPSARAHLASLPALVPTFLSLHWPFRGLLRKEMKRVLRVRALERLVRETTGGGMLLFDEGPLYMLARLLVFGGDKLRTRGFERWWRATIARWAAILDVVVWVDAPDEVLAARIHTRRQPHPFQGADEPSVRAFLRAYRQAFDRVLGELEAAGGPGPYTVATDRTSVDAAAHSLLARLHAPPRAALVPEEAS